MELRVHGIGGTTAASMLGSEPEAALVPCWPRGTRDKPHVWQGNDRNVAVFHWARLTSGSRWFVLWPLLLPFTLLNVAGFMYPLGRLGRALCEVHLLLCLLATGWFAAWLLLAGQLIAENRGWSETGGLVLALGTGALVILPSFARRSWPAGEAATPSTLRPRPLEDPMFFHAGRTLWVVHVLLFLTVITGMWWYQLDRENTTAGAVAANVVVATGIGFVGLLGLLVLGTVAQRLTTPRADREQRAWTLRAAGTTGLGAALIGGLTTAVLRVVVGREHLRGSPFAIFDAYGWGVLVGLAVGVGAAVLLMLRRAAGERIAEYSSKLLPDPISWFRARVALLPRAAALALGMAALTFLVVGTPLFVHRAPATTAEVLGPLPWFDGSTAAERSEEARYVVPDNAVVRIAQWTIYGLFTVMFLNLLRSLGAAGALRRIGSLWDVLSFWPRRFHPFAVRPYTECAVDQLRELLFTDAVHTPGSPLTVVAHSQGTMLAVAALAPRRAPGQAASTEPRRSNVTHLVTAGSPLRSLYMNAFPAYVDDTLVARTSEALAPDGRWTNVFRFTDHVGRSLFVDENAWVVASHPPDAEPQDRWWCSTPLSNGFVGVDCALADPHVRQGSIRGHNDYWTDAPVRKVVG